MNSRTIFAVVALAAFSLASGPMPVKGQETAKAQPFVAPLAAGQLAQIKAQARSLGETIATRQPALGLSATSQESSGEEYFSAWTPKRALHAMDGGPTILIGELKGAYQDRITINSSNDPALITFKFDHACAICPVVSKPRPMSQDELQGLAKGLSRAIAGNPGNKYNAAYQDVIETIQVFLAAGMPRLTALDEDSDNGKTVTVRVGDQVEISLRPSRRPQAPANWQLAKNDSAVLAPMEGYPQRRGGEPLGWGPELPESIVFRFKASNAGTAAITLEHVSTLRIYPPKVLSRFGVVVTVVPR